VGFRTGNSQCHPTKAQQTSLIVAPKLDKQVCAGNRRWHATPFRLGFGCNCLVLDKFELPVRFGLLNFHWSPGSSNMNRCYLDSLLLAIEEFMPGRFLG
jgi:hypothetical protein